MANSPQDHSAHISQQMKWDEMSEACSKSGREDSFMYLLSGNPERTEHIEYLLVEKGINLKSSSSSPSMG